MEHETAFGRLAAFLDGDLPAKEKAAIMAHIETCGACRTRLSSLSETVAGLSSPGGMPMPEALQVRISNLLAAERATSGAMARRRAGSRLRWAPRRRWVLALGGLGVAVALALGLVLVRAPRPETSTVGEAGGFGVPVVRSEGAEYTRANIAQSLGSLPLFDSFAGMKPAEARRRSQEFSSLLAERAGTGEGQALSAPRADSSSILAGGEGTTATQTAPLVGGTPGAEPAASPAASPVATAPSTRATDQTSKAAGAASSPSPTRAAPEVLAAACLAQVRSGVPGPFLPVYLEFARFEGRPALIYAVLTSVPASSPLNRVQIWVLSEDACDVVYMAQVQLRSST
ncbi:MAG: anti-sigma factor [Actinomycetota bacterium]